MSEILGPDGRPAVTAERVKMEKMNRFNPCRGLTPANLGRQLEAYARGDFRQMAWTMQWMEEHDDVIGPVADKAKSAVARHGYDVLIHEEVDEAQQAMAEEQQSVLQKFYQGLTVGHAVEKEECGGMRLLLKQVMDAFGKGYAMHQVIWNPNASNGLSAEVKFVPLWFFENMEGDLRFLESAWSWQGTPISSDALGGRNGWMVSRGRGVMLASAIAWMFKHLPMQDWLTYCSRHGMPAFLGKTQAQFGSDGWNAMADAVSSLSAEWGGVVNQSDAIEVINLTANGQLPFEALVERMDRAFSILWRGGDLSTISRDNAVGSNPQTESSDELDGDNAIWAGETIDRQLGREVIRYYFGEDAPVLAYLKVRTATRDDVERDLKVVEAGVKHGLPISKNYFSTKFGLPMADEDEELLGQAAKVVSDEGVKPGTTANANPQWMTQPRHPKGQSNGGEWGEGGGSKGSKDPNLERAVGVMRSSYERKKKFYEMEFDKRAAAVLEEFQKHHDVSKLEDELAVSPLKNVRPGEDFEASFKKRFREHLNQHETKPEFDEGKYREEWGVFSQFMNGGTSSAANEAGRDALVMNSLSKVLGVRRGMLSAVEPLMGRILEGGGELDYEAFLEFVEDAAESLPELFDPQFAGELADEMEAAMGTAVVRGTRDAIREAVLGNDGGKEES